MGQPAVLPTSGAAKIAITLTAVSAGASLGLFSATWLTVGLGPALPLLVCGVLLLEFGAFMWKGTHSAYVGSVVTAGGLYLYTLVGMSGLVPSPDEAWHIAGLGAVSVLCVSVIVFGTVYLREARAHRSGNVPDLERAAPPAPGPTPGSTEGAKAARDTN